ncbi:MAG: B12-binding domain-containing radical SAM protein [Deltaproteobacteria bacterium]|jgi:radical SAM superfamily enzyme YgiQ (UPF0313 family)|nr:B12-binding domain-containing radical SAM protein [Deltaproteobacteria bacterium]
MKILLIQPSNQNGLKPTRLPASLMALASFLDNKKILSEFFQIRGFSAKETRLQKINIKIIDEQTKSSGYLEKLLEREEFQVVGFTAVTSLIPRAAKLAQIIKKNFSKTITIIGGVHVTAQPLLTLKKFSSFDIAVVGEGEETFAEIIIRVLLDQRIDSIDGALSRLSIDRGIVFRKKVFEYQRHPFIAESLKYLELDNYYEYDVPSGVHIGKHSILRTSIGCPYNCSFCCSSLFSSGKIINIKTADQIFEEILFCYNNYNISSFYVIDDIFTWSKSRILELRDLIVESKIPFKFIIMTRADLLDEDIIVALKEIGVIRCSIGVESGDQVLVNQVIGKKIHLGKIEEITSIIKAHGIFLQYYLIVGLPTQDWNSIAKTVLFILKNNPDSISTSIATPYPGTKLYNDPRIKLQDTEDLSKYYHEPEPQVKVLQFPETYTITDVMDSTEIGMARFIVMSSFQNRNKFCFNLRKKTQS